MIVPVYRTKYNPSSHTSSLETWTDKKTVVSWFRNNEKGKIETIDVFDVVVDVDVDVDADVDADADADADADVNDDRITFQEV